jgi:hypothetical protein
MSLTPKLSAVDEDELFYLDLEDALGESFLDFFLLDFLGGFGMLGLGYRRAVSWPPLSGNMPKGDISRGSSRSSNEAKP